MKDNPSLVWKTARPGVEAVVLVQERGQVSATRGAAALDGQARGHGVLPRFSGCGVGQEGEGAVGVAGYGVGDDRDLAAVEHAAADALVVA